MQPPEPTQIPLWTEGGSSLSAERVWFVEGRVRCTAAAVPECVRELSVAPFHEGRDLNVIAQLVEESAAKIYAVSDHLRCWFLGHDRGGGHHRKRGGRDADAVGVREAAIRRRRRGGHHRLWGLVFSEGYRSPLEDMLDHLGEWHRSALNQALVLQEVDVVKGDKWLNLQVAWITKPAANQTTQSLL